MPQAVFNLPQLPAGTAKHREIRKGPRVILNGGMGIQHIHAAGHAGNLLGNEYPFVKGCLCQY